MRNHTIEFDDGIEKGLFDWRKYYSSLFDFDLTGKKALDVGAADGAFSFEMEKRGALVTAVDIESQSDRDNNTIGIKNVANSQEHPDAFVTNFEKNRIRLGSSVKHIFCNVYDLDQLDESFDVAYCGDLLLHLTDPMRAIFQIANVCTERVILVTPGTLYRRPINRFVDRFSFAQFTGHTGNNAFWFPTKRCLKHLGEAAGLRNLTVSEIFPSKEDMSFAGRRLVLKGEK